MICPSCHQQFNYFNVGPSKRSGGKPKSFPCPRCGTELWMGQGLINRIKLSSSVAMALIFLLSYFDRGLPGWIPATYPLIFAVFVYYIYRASKSSQAVMAGQPASSEPPASQPLPEAVKADGFSVDLSRSKKISPSFYQDFGPLAASIFLIVVVVGYKFFYIWKPLREAFRSSPASLAVLLGIVAVWIPVSLLLKRQKRSMKMAVNLLFLIAVIATTLVTYIPFERHLMVYNFEKQVRDTQSRKIAGALADENYQKQLRDSDRDGLTDNEEAGYKTDAKNADTDGDGLTDYEEIRIYGADPLKADTDHDGRADGAEAVAGYAPAGEGKFDPLTTPETALYFMEHAFAKGDYEAYESVFDYSDSFVDNFIKSEFNTDLEGFKRRFRNKVFLPATKDNVGAVVIYKTQRIGVDGNDIEIDYYRFMVENGSRGVGEPDKTYFSKRDGRWQANLEMEFNESKASDSERWQATKRVYSQE